MITHLHVKSTDDSLNGIAVIGQTIFVKNWLWWPSCFSEIAENQYQPSLCHLITGEEVSIDRQVACEECPRWLKMTEVA